MVKSKQARRAEKKAHLDAKLLEMQNKEVKFSSGRTIEVKDMRGGIDCFVDLASGSPEIVAG